jgi:lipopolysaccharide transport system permease protein
MTFFLFLTPVLYPKPDIGLITSISKYNPVYYLVSVPRDIILTGHSNDLIPYTIYSIISLILFLIFIFIFHITETRVTERI